MDFQWPETETLPYSSRIDVRILKSVFENTSASYKYLFFLSVLDILIESQTPKISLERILLEMLVKSWYPHNYFKLSFGASDQIAKVHDSMDLQLNHKEILSGSKGTEALRETISRTRIPRNSLMNMVPYRLLSPFLKEDLNRLKGSRKEAPDFNKQVIRLAEEKSSGPYPPFYFFIDEGKSIYINHDWMLYFYENYTPVRAFVCWEWLDYMQRRNPSVPNIKMKLFPPFSRDSLTKQSKFWKHVLRYEPITCLFTKELVTLDDFSLDHFLPWSFVAHDQLWNLIPVSKSINSSKSNNLPSFNTYLDGFIKRQHRGLVVYHENAGDNWNSVIEPYLSDLQISSQDILNRDVLSRQIRKTMEPLYGLASAQGFSPDWTYSSLREQ